MSANLKLYARALDYASLRLGHELRSDLFVESGPWKLLSFMYSLLAKNALA